MLEMVKVSKDREKFTLHCDVCGCEYDGTVAEAVANGWTPFNPKTRATKAYVCPDCMEVHDYDENEKVRWSDNGAQGFTYGFEFEMIPLSKASHALLISRDYNFLATKGILPTGGINFKTPVYPNLHGVKQIFRTVAENMIINEETDRQCKTHIHIGHISGYNDNKRLDISYYCSDIFSPLNDYLRDNSTEAEKVFGRQFIGYADYPYLYYGHSSYVNLSHENNIEFILPKMANAEQCFYCVCMIKDFMSEILKVSDGRTAIKCSKKLIKIFCKYANGDANCQRPERNTKA